MLGPVHLPTVARHVGQDVIVGLEGVELGLGVSLTATSGSANKEVERQNYLALIQVSGQISQQIMNFTQVAMQFQGTPLAYVAQHSIGALLELGKRLLEQYDIKNIDQIIPTAPGPGSPGATMAPTPGGQTSQAIPPGSQPGSGGFPPLPPLDAGIQGLYGGAQSGV